MTDVLPLLRSRHASRVAKDKDFQYLIEDIAEFKAQRKKHVISLNEAERRKERNLQEARLKLRTRNDDAETGAASKKSARGNAAAVKIAALQDSGLQADERNLAEDLAAEKERKDAKDVWLNEAANVLGDQVGLLVANTKPGAHTATAPAPISKRE